MTTTVLDAARTAEITARAREVRFWHTLLNVAAVLLIGFGRVLGYGWLVPVWCCLAIRTGWRDVHPPKVSDGPGQPR